ncbi:PREDICTED: uncharacterized protein LOC100633619 isoform X1 [Amphimedon queenslandica]|uniref:USP domain-containing protein n=1 Tax=Amphimedon queenslandica TaxID=400682 RepID=A0AAN0IWP0_AMPQE|nr:PREDICTED: uncharacterized protein LOC100633619 isoform X1 [Amphimedon queenslandica]|eukprot:XP_019848851.1 PREDICTED: uncharacterized protein LOC100633619 isoform X1 [Amphimedon queenslandica]
MDQVRGLVNFFSGSGKNDGITARPVYRGTGAPESSRDRTLSIHGGVGGGIDWPPVSLERSESIVINRGLRNRPGENNCFLNAAVQVLWHVDVFRRSFRQIEEHKCVGETCIFCALKVLYTQYQHSEQNSIPPDMLRNALANCYKDQDRFQLGIMDDAAECFEKLLEKVHYHLTGTADLESCAVKWCIPHMKFALTTVEQIFCPACSKMEEPHTFVEFVHYVSTIVIKDENERLGSTEPDQYFFERTLRMAAESDASSYSPCKICTCRVKLRRMLLSNPDVLCIGMIWDSSSPTVPYIMSVLNSIGLKIRLSRIFDRVSGTGSLEFNLTAMITYYGRHYTTFSYHTKQHSWIYFDDARVRKVGDWNEVKKECRKAHYQPLLLIYTNPHSTTVDITGIKKQESTAPATTQAPPPITKATPTTQTPPIASPAPPIPPKSEVPDMIQFSITAPASQLLAPMSKSNNIINNLTPPTAVPGSTGGVSGGGAYFSGSKPLSDVIDDSVNVDTNSRTDAAIGQRYKQQAPISYANNRPSPSVPRHTQSHLYPRLDDGTPYYINVGSRQTSRAPVSTSTGHSTSTPAYSTSTAAHPPFSSSSASQFSTATSTSANIDTAGYITTSRPYYNTSTPVSGRSTSPLNQLNNVPVPSQQRGGGGVPAKQRPRSDVYPSTRTSGPTGGTTGATRGATGATGGATGATGGATGLGRVTGATGRGTGSMADPDSFVRQFESDFKMMPKDLQIMLLHVGAYLKRLQSPAVKNDVVMTSCLLEKTNDDLKKCIDHHAVQYYSSLRASLKSKKEEIERESRLLKLGKSDCPDLQEVANLLSAKNNQFGVKRQPLGRTPSPDKPPLPRKPKPSAIEDMKTRFGGYKESAQRINSSSNERQARGGGAGGAVVTEPVCNVCHNKRDINADGMCGPCSMKWTLSK